MCKNICFELKKKKKSLYRASRGHCVDSRGTILPIASKCFKVDYLSCCSKMLFQGLEKLFYLFISPPKKNCQRQTTQIKHDEHSMTDLFSTWTHKISETWEAAEAAAVRTTFESFDVGWCLLTESPQCGGCGRGIFQMKGKVPVSREAISAKTQPRRSAARHITR